MARKFIIAGLLMASLVMLGGFRQGYLSAFLLDSSGAFLIDGVGGKLVNR